MKNASLVASWHSLEPHGQLNTAMDVKPKHSPTFIFTIVPYVVGNYVIPSYTVSIIWDTKHSQTFNSIRRVIQRVFRRSQCKYPLVRDIVFWRVIEVALCDQITIKLQFLITGQARLIRSHSSARFCFELSGNLNYIIHCNSNYVQNFKLEINSI